MYESLSLALISNRVAASVRGSLANNLPFPISVLACGNLRAGSPTRILTDGFSGIADSIKVVDVVTMPGRLVVGSSVPAPRDAFDRSYATKSWLPMPLQMIPALAR